FICVIAFKTGFCVYCKNLFLAKSSKKHQKNDRFYGIIFNELMYKYRYKFCGKLCLLSFVKNSVSAALHSKFVTSNDNVVERSC
ncbi:hypothetical protein, partial [Aquimarina sp. MMG016]|uniref:hypothetical protein n=1 Tax=Aquimarina sp. MMG016 TaxID=2822690 RepID=UPI001B3A0D67